MQEKFRSDVAIQYCPPIVVDRELVQRLEASNEDPARVLTQQVNRGDVGKEQGVDGRRPSSTCEIGIQLGIVKGGRSGATPVCTLWDSHCSASGNPDLSSVCQIVFHRDND